MTRWTIVRRSLGYYWRSNLAVALGVAVAVAVLAGSILVGNSVEGSLRKLALERLGRLDHALVSDAFFRESLAADLSGRLEPAGSFDLMVPAIILKASARHAGAREDASGVTVPRVNVLGVREDFWRLGDDLPQELPDGRRVILNPNLADDIGAALGDAILLTAPRRGAAPADTLFGRRSPRHTARSMQLIVTGIVQAKGLGKFSLRSDEPRPRNLYVSLGWLQRQLGREGQANTILAASGPREAPGPDGAHAINQALGAAATLEDYGLRLVPHATLGYLSAESSELVLPEPAVEIIRRTAEESGFRAALTSVYLANSLELVGPGLARRAVPYSVVAGLEAGKDAPFGPLPLVDGDAAPALASDDILLNAWAAADLGARVGDTIEMVYYAASARGGLDTQTRRFTLRGVTAMQGSGVDRGLVPAFEGISNAERIQDWDPPFPIDMARIRDKDEDYWNQYRTAPKAFVSLDTARSLWQSQETPAVGSVTSVRVAPPEPGGLDEAAAGFAGAFLRNLSPGRFGLAFLPLRQQALDAAGGSTDFGVLFLSMSAFLVAAAAGLVGLLLRLTVERRAKQTGILLATGFTQASVTRILMGEGLLLALAGVLIGAPLGVGYAWLIIRALRTWWRGAAGEFTFSLQVGWASILAGSAAGFVIAAVAIWWAVGLLRRARATTLLAGWRSLAAQPRAGRGRRARRAAWAGIVALAGALLVVVSGGFGAVSARAAFFTGGALLLFGALAWLCAGFQKRAAFARSGRLSLARLAWRGARRNWVRSLLTVGLIACASFIIVAVAANRKDLSLLDTRQRTSGAGGFNLMARSDIPLYLDLNTGDGRAKLGFPPETSGTLSGTNIVSLRMRTGDDISCLNLQRPGTPRLLGAPRELIERNACTFSALLADEAAATENPWKLLERAQPQSGPAEKQEVLVIPAFADATSAQWVLHKGLGDSIELLGNRGQRVRLLLVGLLKDSIFAGEVLISEQEFVRHFGADGGYRYFLVETPAGTEAAVANALRQDLGRMGFDVTRTADALARFAGVQNTYLASFQTLGGLGLLLGTFGVVTVLLRGVMERRSEFGMMLALGFRRTSLLAMVLMENGLLLLFGLAIGTAAALLAVAPHLVST
ncbi:MAG: ABC transporter permease, partial [Candidatus Brocadiia bacterium]|nr:ABC transporter permease [Candidatus Brocadiia bacterium]